MIARRDMRVRLAARRELSPSCFLLELVTDTPFEAQPGQFGMLACRAGRDPFLRRPFSLAAVGARGEGTVCELLVKEVGRGSRALRELAVGGELQLLAPLGRGFHLATPEGGRLALVAGGIGLPPLLFAAERLAAAGQPFDLFLGAATAAELLLVERCQRAVGAVGGELVLATDDGSRGERGVITEALARRWASGAAYATALACGPTPMLAALTQLARSWGLELQLSLEEPMACGVGVCLGCVVDGADGRRVTTCKEGPVFRASELAARWWQ
jgi:dihydroorotate dehydrogenase electron transfer subunit